MNRSLKGRCHGNRFCDQMCDSKRYSIQPRLCPGKTVSQLRVCAYEIEVKMMCAVYVLVRKPRDALIYLIVIRSVDSDGNTVVVV